jgi:hypothetical protein
MLPLLSRDKLLVVWGICSLCIFSCGKTQKEVRREKLTEVEYTRFIKLDSVSVSDTIKVNTLIKNIGDTTLMIKYVKTSCGCTEAVVTNNRLAPHDSTKLGIKILSRAESYFNKSVYIFCNVKESPLKISISGQAFNDNLPELP